MVKYVSSQADFIFACCQVGAEAALKREVAREHNGFRPAFSRPGFVTFKAPVASVLLDSELKSVFARCSGVSIGRLTGEDAQPLADQLWQLTECGPFAHVHAWERDHVEVGTRGFSPSRTAIADDVGRIIAASATTPLAVNQKAKAGELVLDCVLVEPNEWWIGQHKVSTISTRFPGGVIPQRLSDSAVSRAYHKMSEALQWSELPLRRSEKCVEIGSAPGGATQMLLERGLVVVGVDPADMDERILAHPRFTHVRKRGRDLRKRDLRGFRWLVADSNVVPRQTLDTVESIATHAAVQLRGLLLTLKLPDWNLAEEIPSYVDRVRGWGFKHVRLRQLATNRREVCLAALRTRSQRRQLRQRPRRRSASS